MEETHLFRGMRPRLMRVSKWQEGVKAGPIIGPSDTVTRPACRNLVDAQDAIVI